MGKKQSLDFQRNKSRLGRKQVSSNATDTSFKAKTVALPHQSILVERGGALRTARGQTLADLRLAANHPNGGTRRDAFQGMLSLLQSHERIGIATSPAVLAVVIPVTANHLADRDGSVRLAIRNLLAWLLPRAMPVERALAPLMDTLLFFLPGAMSFDMAVKADSVRSLTTILAHLPSATRNSLAAGWTRLRLSPPASVGDDAGHAGTLLIGLLNMFGISLPTGARSGSTKAGPAGATGTIEVPLSTRVSVLTALRRLLDTVYPGTDPTLPISGRQSEQGKPARRMYTCPTWFFAHDFSSSSGWELFSRMLAPLRPGAGHASFLPGPQGGESAVPPLPDSDLMDVESTIGSTFRVDQLSAMVQAAAHGAPGSTAPDATDTMDTAKDLFLLLAPTLTALYVEVAVEAVEALRSIALLPSGAAAAKAARTGSDDGSLDAHLDSTLQTVFGITLLVRRLFRSMRLTSEPSSEDELQTALGALLAQMSKHFPLSIPSLPAHVAGAQDGGRAYRQNEAALRAINLAYAELCVRSAHASRRIPSWNNLEDTETTGSHRRQATDGTDAVPQAKRRKGLSRGRAQAAFDTATRSVQLQHVSDYLLELLRHGYNDGALTLVGHSEEAEVDLDALESILPTAWLLLSLPQTDDAKDKGEVMAVELVEALVARFRALPASAPSKGSLFAFLARIAMVDRFPSYTGTFHTVDLVDDSGNSPLTSFLLEIPPYMWASAAASHGQADRQARTQPMIDFLRLVILDEEHTIFFADDLVSLQGRLVPFFKLHNGKCMARNIDLTSVISAFPSDTLSPPLSTAIHAATPYLGC